MLQGHLVNRLLITFVDNCIPIQTLQDRSSVDFLHHCQIHFKILGSLCKGLVLTKQINL